MSDRIIKNRSYFAFMPAEFAKTLRKYELLDEMAYAGLTPLFNFVARRLREDVNLIDSSQYIPPIKQLKWFRWFKPL